MRSALAVLLLLAACHGDDVATPDATAPDATIVPPDSNLAFPCLGMPAPTGDAIAGKVFEVVDFAVSPAVGATVEIRARADDALLASGVTADDGSFAIAVTADDVIVAVSIDGDLPTREVPASRDNLLVVTASSDEVASWYAQAGAAYTLDARTVLAGVSDCDGGAAIGATITTSPAATITYYDDQAKRWDPALAASTNGFALVTNAPADLTITPAIAPTSLPPRTIAATSGTLTIAAMSPRE
jgi:hypothetical protein